MSEHVAVLRQLLADSHGPALELSNEESAAIKAAIEALDRTPQPVTPAGGEVEPVVDAVSAAAGAASEFAWDCPVVPLSVVADVLRKTHPPAADAALVRDAERYRFLKAGGYEHCDDEQPYIALAKVDGWGKHYVDIIEDDEADAAIDAALNQRGGGNG